MNAIEVVKDKSNGRVVVTLSEEGNAVCIKVEDNGEKLSDAEWKQISQLAIATTKHSGLGFGLSIVAGLLRIWAEESHLSESLQEGFQSSSVCR